MNFNTSSHIRDQVRFERNIPLSNDEIKELIHEQLQHERRISIMEKCCQQVSLDANKFLNSKLVNAKRIYGYD